MTLAWSTAVVARRLRLTRSAWNPVPTWLVSTLCVLGWVLLLDTFALTPTSVYAWGFGVPVLLGSGVLMVVVIVAACQQQSRDSAWVVLGCLGVYALTRLPTGNVWDALLDPWLWLILQVRLLRAGVMAWRARAATRAAAANAPVATDSST